jgi:AcrR family transcriptional regulator
MSRERLILEAATQMFAEKSFAAVGIDAIATAAGITGSGIYRHFSSKDEILASIFDRLTDQLLVRMGPADSDPNRELDRLIALHIEFTLDHPDLTTIWQREQSTLSAHRRRGFQRRQRLYIDRWIATLDACYPGNERERLLTTVRAAHGLISSDLSRPARTRRDPDLPALLHRMTRLAFDALAPVGVRDPA